MIIIIFCIVRKTIYQVFAFTAAVSALAKTILKLKVTVATHGSDIASTVMIMMLAFEAILQRAEHFFAAVAVRRRVVGMTFCVCQRNHWNVSRQLRIDELFLLLKMTKKILHHIAWSRKDVNFTFLFNVGV